MTLAEIMAGVRITATQQAAVAEYLRATWSHRRVAAWHKDPTGTHRRTLYDASRRRLADALAGITEAGQTPPATR